MELIKINEIIKWELDKLTFLSCESIEFCEISKKNEKNLLFIKKQKYITIYNSVCFAEFVNSGDSSETLSYSPLRNIPSETFHTEYDEIFWHVTG